jgi:hypothetical protein
MTLSSGMHPDGDPVRMQDPINPTDEELREWAYKERWEPVEDFVLMVADVERAALLIELTRSPQREFFFRCLYLIVGDAVRTKFNTAARPDVEAMLASAAVPATHDQAIAAWVKASRELLEHPDRFEYEAWCDGGLARDSQRP